MLSNTPSTRRIVRADKPFVSGPRHRADFARQATIAAFGRHARALDYGDFDDRLPNQPTRRLDGQLARGAA